ncbi:serine C-palmitoyltransferase [Starmerella bacillaris]|uniref:serine C-palmitoyltransferase n=1 Tax=Starmerella bacillaris TaxID=1247836 RepID=A0AAV5RKE8_STABA|nr:serine C-palmitoyltransferase [Starmerella bacillaris]
MSVEEKESVASDFKENGSKISGSIKDYPSLAALNHHEFAELESTNYLYKQQLTEPVKDRTEELVPYYIMLETHFLYLVLLVIGHIRDFIDSIFNQEYRANLKENNGYAPLLTDFDSFYTRRFKQRLQDLFACPTTAVPGREIKVYRRKFIPNSFFEIDEDFWDEEPVSCINLSSYNYLGFAQSVGTCADNAESTVEKYGIVAGGSRFGGGCLDIQEDTENLVAKFVGKEAAMIFSMGYGTNAMLISNLVDKKCLVLSDQLNHASLRTGIRLSGAVIKVFKHNDMDELEKLIREQIAQGQPRSRRPWDKILIVFEGLYSMEGTMCNLPKLVEFRERYGVYLFMDEAHSIGAMGPNGRGICDYYKISPSKIDCLMGTFTKSFGSVGGYIAGDQLLIDHLKVSNLCSVYAEAPAPPALSQIATSIKIISGEINPGEGEFRLRRLAFNSRYLRVGLRKMGFIVCGHIDSPVIPVFLYHPTKMPLTAHKLMEFRIAVVLVGYPATDLATSRIRFCMSAALSKSDLDYVLEKMEEVGDLYRLKVAIGLDGNPAPRARFADFKDTLWKEVLNPKLN